MPLDCAAPPARHRRGISAGTHTVDLGRSTGTSNFAKAVIAAMRNADIDA